MAEQAARAGRERAKGLGVEDERPRQGGPSLRRGRCRPAHAFGDDAVVVLARQLGHAVLVDAEVAGDGERAPARRAGAPLRDRRRGAPLSPPVSISRLPCGRRKARSRARRVRRSRGSALPWSSAGRAATAVALRFAQRSRRAARSRCLAAAIDVGAVLVAEVVHRPRDHLRQRGARADRSTRWIERHQRACAARPGTGSWRSPAERRSAGRGAGRASGGASEARAPAVVPLERKVRTGAPQQRSARLKASDRNGRDVAPVGDRLPGRVRATGRSADRVRSGRTDGRRPRARASRKRSARGRR